jgi:hypothetical protein
MERREIRLLALRNHMFYHRTTKQGRIVSGYVHSESSCSLISRNSKDQTVKSCAVRFLQTSRFKSDLSNSEATIGLSVRWSDTSWLHCDRHVSEKRLTIRVVITLQSLAPPSKPPRYSDSISRSMTPRTQDVSGLLQATHMRMVSGIPEVPCRRPRKCSHWSLDVRRIH